MDGSNIIFYWLGVIAVLGLLWTFALVRAFSSIQTNAFFGKDRPLHPFEFWRYVLCCTLFFVTSSIIVVIVSRYDDHYPIYQSSTAIARVIAASLISGLALGLGSWFLQKLVATRKAKFHRPNPTTWKALRFWGPKKRKMTRDERDLFLKKMDFLDYLVSIGNAVLSLALLYLMFLSFELMIKGALQGFAPVFKSFFRHLLPVEIFLIVLAILLGSVLWLFQRLCVWLGWSRTLC